MPASFIIVNISSTATVFIPEVFMENNKIFSLPLFFSLANANFKHEDTDPLTAPFCCCSVRGEEKAKPFQCLPVTIGLSSKIIPSGNKLDSSKDGMKVIFPYHNAVRMYMHA